MNEQIYLDNDDEFTDSGKKSDGKDTKRKRVLNDEFTDSGTKSDGKDTKKRVFNEKCSCIVKAERLERNVEKMEKFLVKYGYICTDGGDDDDDIAPLPLPIEN
uniref:Uncharacterized protein n=1 Tax=Amphimedon queenslandica TaxID=400682 RepID=A0A1X7UP98_AMPQE